MASYWPSLVSAGTGSGSAPAGAIVACIFVGANCIGTSREDRPKNEITCLFADGRYCSLQVHSYSRGRFRAPIRRAEAEGRPVGASPYKDIFRLPTVSHVLLSVLDGCRVNNLGTMLLKDWKCLMEERVLPLWGWFERCFAVTSAVYIHLDPVSPLYVTPSGPPVPLPLFHWSAVRHGGRYRY